MFDLRWSQRYLQKRLPDAITYGNPVRRFPCSLVWPNEVKEVVHFHGSIKISPANKARNYTHRHIHDPCTTPRSHPLHPPTPLAMAIHCFYVIGCHHHHRGPFEDVLMKVGRRAMIERGLTLLNKIAERRADGLRFCYRSIAIVAACQQWVQCCI